MYLTYNSQRKDTKAQRQLITQQQFESTFFNMLNVHRELKIGLKYSKRYLTHNPFERFGLDVIYHVNDDFKARFLKVNNAYIGEKSDYSEMKLIKENLKKYSNESKKLELTKIEISFEATFNEFQNFISHYCRNVYHILRYIRENEKNETLGKDLTKYKNYANIFQSQLNVDEQFLLFYNFIFFNDIEKEDYSTIELVNHYSFLENLGSNNLINRLSHNNKNFYSFDIK